MTPGKSFAPPDRPTADAGAQLREKVNRALRHRARLEAVGATGLLDGPLPIPALDRVARLAARALRAPAVALTLLTDKMLHPIAVHIDGGRQDEWSKPRRVGFSYAKYVVWSKGPLLVEDARNTELLRHSHVTRDYDVIAYLGVPIVARSGTGTRQFVVGVLSVIDHVPRGWTQDDVYALEDLAAIASEEIELRRRTGSAAMAEEDRAAQLVESIAAGVLGTDSNGVITFANPAAEALLGYSAAELLGHDQHALMHHTRPDGTRYRESDCPYYRARRESREVRVRADTYWRSDGTPIVVDATMVPVFDRDEITGTVLTFVDVQIRQDSEQTERERRDVADTAKAARSALIATMSEEFGAVISRLAQERERLESGVAAGERPQVQTGLDALRQNELDLRRLVESMQHVAGL